MLPMSDKAIWEELANLAKEAREKLGYSQSELARLVGCHPSRINRFEKAGRLNRSTLFQVRHVLKDALEMTNQMQEFTGYANEAFRFEHPGQEGRSVNPLDSAPAVFAEAAAVLREERGPRHDGVLWLRLLEVGRMLAQRVEPEEARHAYKTALDLNDSPAARALVLAEQAEPMMQLNDMHLALAYTDEALLELQKLGVGDVAPERMDSIDIVREITRPLKNDQVALDAYSVLTRARLGIFDTNQDYEDEKLCLVTLKKLGNKLDNPRMVAEALQIEARLLRETATKIEDSWVAWRKARNLGLIRKASASLQDALLLRPKDDRMGRGHDWRNMARLKHLLGDERDAFLAEGAARELLGEGRLALSLDYDQAVWALANGQDKRAEAMLLQILYTGRDIKSRDFMSRSLSNLGLLYTIGERRSEFRQRAMLCLAASLLAWPPHYKRQEYRKVVQLLRDLVDGTPDGSKWGDDLMWFMRKYGNEFPFDLLLEIMPHLMKETSKILVKY